MSDQRFIIEMAMGTDLHGENYTKAATRAVESALRRSSLLLLGVPGIDRDALRVQVTVGVQDPDKVDRSAIAALLPIGKVSVTVTRGGLNSTHPQTGSTIVVAAAAVEAFLPSQSGVYRPA